MCIPALAFVGTAMGASAATAAAVGTVTTLSAASSALSAVGAYNQAKATKQSMEYQSQVANRNATLAEYAAQDAEARGQTELQRARRANDQLRGTQRATMAARGLDLSEGSPLALLDDTEYFGALDQTTIKDNTSKEAWRVRSQGQNYAANSAAYSTAAGNINPGMSLASSLITSSASVADKWFKLKG